MQLLDSFPALQEAFEKNWRPVSTPALIGWMIFYGAFLLHALTNRSGFLIIDSANLIVHESGHLLFGWFGPKLGLWGGTLMELLVPLALTLYFAFHRQTTGAAFTTFFFFENFLYISVYAGDARAQVLPLVTVGDTSEGAHDWFRILSSLGLLQQDTAIAGAIKTVGWLGMLATLGWLVKRARAG